MRLQKTFEIEGYDRKFTVKELTVKEIISLMSGDLGDLSLNLEEFKEAFGENFLPLCTDITLDDLIDMAPSEIKICWEKFREVNATFFEVARTSGMDGLLQQIRDAIIADFSKWLVPSSKRDTETA
jgi:hypothetical protein